MKAFRRQNKLPHRATFQRRDYRRNIKKQHTGREFLGSQDWNVRVVNVRLLAVDTHRVSQLDQWSRLRALNRFWVNHVVMIPWSIIWNV